MSSTTAGVETSGTKLITSAHEEDLARDGYAIVEGFLTGDELEAAQSAACGLVPSVAEYAGGDPSKSAWPGTEMRYFPHPADVLNDVALHPELIAFAQRWVGTAELAFGREVLWAKYGVGIDFDQQFHVDYRGNTLVAPREEPGFRSVIAILYYTDVTDDLGPTCVLSHRDAEAFVGTSDRILREDHPAAYEREVPVTVSAGTLLLYTLSTWHRGSAMKAEGGFRLSQHMVFRPAAQAWMAAETWGHRGGQPDMVHFMERATPYQRSFIGFPRVGDPYWTAETVAAVGARYPNMDMTPYAEACS